MSIMISLVFFFKQKTAYEMRISDWSSDVCSSDLLEAADGTCELCGQQELRYHFEIENDETAGSLLVGSECIKRFEIAGIDEQGQRLDARDTGRLVDRHRRGLVEDARKQRVMTALLKLGRKAPDFDAQNFIPFVEDKGALTPTPVAMPFWPHGSAGVASRHTALE